MIAGAHCGGLELLSRVAENGWDGKLAFGELDDVAIEKWKEAARPKLRADHVSLAL